MAPMFNLFTQRRRQGAITDKWLCSSCCTQFKNGTYVTLEDYEALEGRRCTQ